MRLASNDAYTDHRFDPIGFGRQMTILVTGGAGYIGSQVVLELLGAHEKVVVTSEGDGHEAKSVYGRTIIGILREQEAGAKTADVCRKHGVSSATFYK